ncbi:unnamed protein product [Cuscuta campestris]|uniref:Uncharacterized protein n=1 Tax=Cuscuta campestris TaxID=132261 RepID=A0A484M3I8_9ASTE|nr:unnamed protein product [Cuscuta campestris]
MQSEPHNASNPKARIYSYFFYQGALSQNLRCFLTLVQGLCVWELFYHFYVIIWKEFKHEKNTIEMDNMTLFSWSSRRRGEYLIVHGDYLLL